MGWYVPVSTEDLDRWKEAGHLEFYQELQIDPRTLSIAGINHEFGAIRNEWDGDFVEALIADMNSRTQIHDPKKLETLYDFVFETHTYCGEGKYRYHPLLGPIYKYPKPFEWCWPIFIPDHFEILYQGIKRGLSYLVISDLKNQCEFLDANSCKIHAIKPHVCKEFPYQEIDGQRQLALFEEFIKICPGLKRQSIPDIP